MTCIITPPVAYNFRLPLPHESADLLRAATVEHAVSTLSGGERFRVALARLLLADPPPQLLVLVLVLDEPTNDLDR